MHVFISYHHNDLDFAENVISRLEKEGLNTWADSKLLAGEDWRIMIDLAIKDAFALIVIMTPEAKASEYVTYEWAFAWGVGVKVIPIMLKKTPLHPRLEALQYLDFTAPKSRPWERLIEEARNAASRPLAHSVHIPLNASPFIRQAVTALDSAFSQERISAIETLVQSQGAEVQEVLLEVLKHPIADVREAAAQALGRVGDTSALPALCEVLHDTDASVRAAATQALGKIGDASVVPTLCGLLHDGVYAYNVTMYICEIAASALGQIQDASAVPALCEALHDEHACRAAAQALGKIGDASAAPALYKALNDHKYDPHGSIPHMVDVAAEALGSIGGASVIAILCEALNDASPVVRRAAAKALGKCGDASVRVNLCTTLHDKDQWVRVAAAKSLGEICGASAVPALHEALLDADASVRAAVVEALGEIGDVSEVPILCKALNDPDAPVCAAAAEALGKIGDASAVPALREFLNNPSIHKAEDFDIWSKNSLSEIEKTLYIANKSIRKLEERS